MKNTGHKPGRLDPVFPPADFHTMVQVSPLAIMAIVGFGFDLLHIARTKGEKWELVSLQPTPRNAFDGIGEAKKIVAGTLTKVCQLTLPEVAHASKAA